MNRPAQLAQILRNAIAQADPGRPYMRAPLSAVREVAGVLEALQPLQVAEGVGNPYAPLTLDEVRDLTSMQAGAPWPENVVAGVVELFALADDLRAKGKRPVDPANENGHSHRWNDEGEKCLKCGDKDWMADRFCSVSDAPMPHRAPGAPVPRDVAPYLAGLTPEPDATPSQPHAPLPEAQPVSDNGAESVTVPLDSKHMAVLKRFSQDLDISQAKVMELALRVYQQHIERQEAHGKSGEAHGKSGEVACKRCGGSGVVDDGEIDCYPNGEPYLNGPVKCVKDCPACAGLAAENNVAMVVSMDKGAREPRIVSWNALPAGITHLFANRAQRAAPAAEAAAPAAPKRVYLVATGQTHDNAETYTRHDSPPPLSEFEVLLDAAPSHPAPALPDAARLDLMLELDAFKHTTKTDAGGLAYQLWNQDEDEGYHVLSGEGQFFPNPRAAIDAALAAQAQPTTQGTDTGTDGSGEGGAAS